MRMDGEPPVYPVSLHTHPVEELKGLLDLIFLVLLLDLRRIKNAST
jgi:hypothetical protein